MNINELKEKPIWQMTGEEFLFLQQNGEENLPVTNSNKKYVKQVAGEKKKTINIQQHNSKSIFQ